MTTTILASIGDGLERFTASWFENLLIPLWLSAMPEVQAILELTAIRVISSGSACLNG